LGRKEREIRSRNTDASEASRAEVAQSSILLEELVQVNNRTKKGWEGPERKRQI
jgi:hypothetical protein